MSTKKEADIQNVKSKFPNNASLKSDEKDQLRRVLNFYGLTEKDVYETAKESTDKEADNF